MSGHTAEGPGAEAAADRVDEALRGLRRRLRRFTDDAVHFEFLEDDLREGRRSLGEVEGFFEEVIALLARPAARASEYVDLADDAAVLDRLDELVVVVNNLRRRLVQLATRG